MDEKGVDTIVGLCSGAALLEAAKSATGVTRRDRRAVAGRVTPVSLAPPRDEGQHGGILLQPRRIKQRSGIAEGCPKEERDCEADQRGFGGARLWIWWASGGLVGVLAGAVVWLRPSGRVFPARLGVVIWNRRGLQGGGRGRFVGWKV